jgi:Xaa-Pro aminopeptidase
MSQTLIDPQLLAQRRAEVLRRLGGAAAVIPAAPLVTHHADVSMPSARTATSGT